MKILYCMGLLIIFSLSAISQNTSFHSFKIDSVSNVKQIDFSKFSGKKILIVNAAALDTNYFQWKELKELQNNNKSKIVVVILPANGYSDSNVATFFNNTNFPFIICSKSTANSSSINEIYEWLGKQSLNGLMDSDAKAPLNKYLIDETGKLIAVFKPLGLNMTDAFNKYN